MSYNSLIKICVEVNIMKKKLLGILLIFMTLLIGVGCSLDILVEDEQNNGEIAQNEKVVDDVQEELLQENQAYYSVDEVALYIHTYGKLPPNYITKSEASKLGWESSKGNLWEVTDKGVIGGDRFGNYEGILPDQKQRKWFEGDVNYSGGFRGAERIVYSNDGLIYYTEDHYENFTQLY